jgi:hypothetical protein
MESNGSLLCSQELSLTLSQMSLILSIQPHLFEIYFNAIIPSTCRLFKWFFFQSLRPLPCIYFLSLSCMLYAHQSHADCFVTPVVSDGVRFSKFLITELSQFHYHHSEECVHIQHPV